MGYRYIEDISYADVAFEAEGNTLEELFRSAADALMQVMVADLNSIEPRSVRRIHLKSQVGRSNEDLANLLCEFLQKLIYWKDVDQLLLRVRSVTLARSVAGDTIDLTAETEGEQIDSRSHSLGSDIKAVTYHQLKVWQENERWKAVVVVDT